MTNSASTGGQMPLQRRPASGGVSTASRSSASRARTSTSVTAMTRDLLAQVLRDLTGERRRRRRLDAPRLRQVDLPFTDDAAGPGPEQNDPLCEHRRLAHVVRDEQDRAACLLPDPHELLVQN